MKLPVYESQTRTPNAPQFSALADVRAGGNLGALADGLENYQKVRQAELAEAQKTEWYKADNGFKMDILRARTDMINSIQNGGAYADAEAKFQKTFDASKAKYAPFFAGDENIAQRQAVEFERAGLEGLLSIREAVQQRRKGDAVASANIRAQDVSERLLRAKIDGNQLEIAKLTSEMSSIYAGATAAGAVQADAAKLKIKETLSEMNAQHALYVAEGDPEAGLATLEGYYKSGDISAENYIRLRGPMIEKSDEVKSLRSAVELFNSSPTALSEKQMGVYENALMEKANKEKSFGNENAIQGFYAGQLDMASKTGIFGPQFNLQMNNMASIDLENSKPDDLNTVANLARVFKSAPSSAKAKLNKDARIVYDLINARIDSGMADESAVRQVLSARKMIPSGKTFDEFQTSVLKEFDKDGGSPASYLFEKRDGFFGLGGYRPGAEEIETFEKNYTYLRAMGEDPDNAKKIAAEDATRKIGKYKNYSIKFPPSYAYPGIVERDFNDAAVVSKLREAGIYDDRYEYIIQSDRLTEKEIIERGIQRDDQGNIIKSVQPTYRIMMRDEMGAIIPVTDKNGNIYPNIRTKPLDTYKKRESGLSNFMAGRVLG